MKEIAVAQGADMRALGIYYTHDDVDWRKGYAMIVGPEGTPYAHCPLMFMFTLPADYPISNPKVVFLTSDGKTRFHPNLYVEGKVCLSILGTWSGPSWIASMTISTVLTSILSLLEENPIVNEPGWEKYTLEHKRAKDYAEYVKHALVSHSFREFCKWKEGNMPPVWARFEDDLDEIGDGIMGKLYEVISENASNDEVKYESVVYNMAGTTNWKVLKDMGAALSHR